MNGCYIFNERDCERDSERVERERRQRQRRELREKERGDRGGRERKETGVGGDDRETGESVFGVREWREVCWGRGGWVETEGRAGERGGGDKECMCVRARMHACLLTNIFNYTLIEVFYSTIACHHTFAFLWVRPSPPAPTPAARELVERYWSIKSLYNTITQKHEMNQCCA